MENKKIPVLEVFGPTIQGEGIAIGQKTMFVRTAGCDYRCAWCDSAFTWDGSAKNDIRQLTASDVYEELEEIGEDRYGHVTISGGNPALLPSIATLVSQLHEKGKIVAVETQGSIWQDWLLDIDELTISPKPPSSKMDTNFEKLDEIISRLTNQQSTNQKVSLKVVVFNDEDYTYAKKIHKRYSSIPFFLQVGNSDVTSETMSNTGNLLSKLEWLVEKVITDSEMNVVRVLPQLHTLIWGNKRGV